MTDRGRPLEELARLVGGRLRSAADAAITVTGIQQDSRRVGPGDLFVALRGATTDGLRFAPGAIERGAVAVLVEQGRTDTLDLRVPVLEVTGSRRALAELAAELNGRPSEQLKVLGITGTNGKTTCAHLLRQALGPARTGIVGTLGYRFADLDRPAIHTSPEADVVQAVLGEMRDRDARYVAMEVSSIALAAERVHAVMFAGALFTNLSQDHLDYHGTMQAYAAAKDRLFVDFDPPATAINLDDDHGRGLFTRLASADATVRGYAVGRDASVRAEDLTEDAGGISMTVATPGGRHRVRSPLVGAHNVENLLGVLALADALADRDEAIDVAAVAEALSGPVDVPGRLERCDGPDDDVVAVVDYAHTPDALARVLKSLRPLTTSRLWCVFGCGGDRDPDKRGPMGAAVARGADVAIVTNDNPRSESPEAIAEAVVAGLREAGADAYEVELDRAAAIGRAVRRAQPGDVVLVAGKGHEPYQIIGDRTLDFDDRVELRAALDRRRRGKS